jgi:hypothetical protein
MAHEYPLIQLYVQLPLQSLILNLVKLVKRLAPYDSCRVVLSALGGWTSMTRATPTERVQDLIRPKGLRL